MRYKNLLFLVFYLKNVSCKYATPRWLTICKSSNISSWYKNTTSNIKEFLQCNGFDILYM